MYVSLSDAFKLVDQEPEKVQAYCVYRVADALELSGERVLKGDDAKAALKGYMVAQQIPEECVTWSEATDGTPYLRVETDELHPYRLAYLHPPKMDAVIYAF